MNGVSLILFGLSLICLIMYIMGDDIMIFGIFSSAISAIYYQMILDTQKVKSKR